MELIRKYKQGKLTTADIRKFNNTVICLMVLVAIFSIVWSISLHILSGDFYDGIISAKLEFRERDFAQMDNRSQEIFNQDLSKITQSAYFGDGHLKVTKSAQESQTAESLLSESQTKKPKVAKIAHVYESKENAPIISRLLAQEAEIEASTTTNAPPKIVFNPEADREYLATMSIDARATIWSQSANAQFVYTFPFISEIVAIIWTAMCLIFQTGTKKTGGLPKPWRIVVPSMAIFTLMSIGSVAYTILTNGYLKRLCGDLRGNLTNPSAISCGDAIVLLRPFIREHRVSFDVHLELFRFSYILSMLLWIVALLVMVLRYIFAVDFQLVDIDDMFEHHKADSVHIQPVYTEVPQNQRPAPARPKSERPRSEDDFQSAKSRLSDLAVPLLETLPASQQRQQSHIPTVA